MFLIFLKCGVPLSSVVARTRKRDARAFTPFSLSLSLQSDRNRGHRSRYLVFTRENAPLRRASSSSSSGPITAMPLPPPPRETPPVYSSFPARFPLFLLGKARRVLETRVPPEAPRPRSGVSRRACGHGAIGFFGSSIFQKSASLCSFRQNSRFRETTTPQSRRFLLSSSSSSAKSFSPTTGILSKGGEADGALDTTCESFKLGKLSLKRLPVITGTRAVLCKF